MAFRNMSRCLFHSHRLCVGIGASVHWNSVSCNSVCDVCAFVSLRNKNVVRQMNGLWHLYGTQLFHRSSGSIQNFVPLLKLNSTKNYFLFSRRFVANDRTTAFAENEHEKKRIYKCFRFDNEVAETKSQLMIE